MSSAPVARYEWCVIGAGPAGIAAVGQLLDRGVPASSLVWVDPSFTVGDFGTRWCEVSSNTTVRLFAQFYRACKTFDYHGVDEQKQPFAIESLPPSTTCQLELAAQPLRHITRTLRQSVCSVQAAVSRLSQGQQAWRVHTEAGGHVDADNVVLAIGSEPSSLAGKVGGAAHLAEIPLTVALKPSELARAVRPGNTVAVFGSSHSAVIIIRELLARGVQVVNVYRDPLRYALYLPDFILFDDTGLKGETARWARENLHSEQLPAGLTRVLAGDAAVADKLAAATHVIFATGFARRSIAIDGMSSPASYNPHCGILAPGLFGCGIAFPQLNIDRFRNEELRVGLWKFMEYLTGVVPLWMQYSVNKGIGQPPKAKL